MALAQTAQQQGELELPSIEDSACGEACFKVKRRTLLHWTFVGVD